MRIEHKDKVFETVVNRIIEKKIANAIKIPLETIINDTIYYERKRLDNEKKGRKKKQEIQYWKKVNKDLINASQSEKEELLRKITEGFVTEIIGNFSPKVYKFTTKTLPILLSIFLNTMSPKTIFANFPRLPDVSDTLIIDGEIEMLQSLHKKGTVILVPTHSSNMDSMLVGWALHKINLPPFTYGAGLNLFNNFILSFFMNNLGAYTVDRKKHAALYKDILKEYTTCALEFGYHNLFFPGGARSRTGEIESRLKLGLLGTGIRAYINNLKNKKEKPNIFVVPCTISFQLVLEAENLIADSLKETGKSRYIIEDDEFSKLRRISNFLTSILRLDSKIYVRFCPAFDLFGNRVDSEGISYDKRGRPIDITRYVLVDGKVEHNQQRDREYTKELGEVIKKSFYENNIVMSLHILAFVVFRLLKKYNKDTDLYRLLRTGGKTDSFGLTEITIYMEKLLERLHKLENQGKIRIDKQIRAGDINAIMEEALKHFSSYHTKVVMYEKDGKIYHNYPNLIYYYHNRLVNYGLEKIFEG